jgi:hypothetical protein
MKCKRCGKEVPDDTTICDCGFNFVEDEIKSVIFDTKPDPDVIDKDRNVLIDNPILTFLFGITSVAFMIMFLFHPGFVVLYFGLALIMIMITMWFSRKPTRVKLEPTRNVGVWMAYFALAITVFKAIYFLFGILFF